MNEAIKQLAFSPRGRKTMRGLQRLMTDAVLHLDATNRQAFLGLVEEYWHNPATCSDAIDNIVEKTDTPVVYVAIKDGGDVVTVHSPRSLDVDFVLLDCDEPDRDGLRARGLQHPADESASLERDRNYKTKIL